MYLSNRNIEDVVEDLKHKARYIGLKYPQNYDIESFESYISAKRIERQKFTISHHKGTYWEFSLYEFHSDFCTARFGCVKRRRKSAPHASALHPAVHASEIAALSSLLLAVSVQRRGRLSLQARRRDLRNVARHDDRADRGDRRPVDQLCRSPRGYESGDGFVAAIEAGRKHGAAAVSLLSGGRASALFAEQGEGSLPEPQRDSNDSGKGEERLPLSGLVFRNDSRRDPIQNEGGARGWKESPVLSAAIRRLDSVEFELLNAAFALSRLHYGLHKARSRHV